MQPGDQPRTVAAAAANAATLRAALGRANGWTVLRHDAVTAIRSAEPRQQRAVITNPSMAQHDVTHVLDGFFGGQAPHYLIEDHWGRDWQAVGCERFAAMPIMTCASSPPMPRQVDVDVVQVSTGAQLEAFERTLVDAFPLTDHRPWRPGALWTPAVLRINGLRLLLGLRDATPVATSVAWSHDGAVGAYWIAVLPRHRGVGCGRAMTAAALTGATPGLLIATTAGRRMYERLGLRAVATSTWWTRT
jgi:ribosomal protein S18 acetylase RimI-like enzyme